MLRTAILSLAVCAGAQAAMAEQNQDLTVNDRPFLDLIGELEGPDGYDDVVMGAKIQPPRPLTQMTINEVLSYQRELQLKGSASTAVGRYQFIRKTLKYMTEKHDIDGERLFDRKTQNLLARIIMSKCHFYKEDASAYRVGNCLARAWAALPVLSGEKAGSSYYGAIGNNAARTTREEVLSTLRQRFEGDEPVQVAMTEPLPVIRNPANERFADPIPLKP